MASKYKAILSDIMSSVDNIKDKISDDEYLKLTADLKLAFDEKENKLYEITFISLNYSRLDTNIYSVMPSKFSQIIKLTEDEHRELRKLLTKTKNFVKLCCNIVLDGIVDRLIHTEYSELIGQYQTNNQDDMSDTGIEMSIKNNLVITGCKKM